jgi:osmoprotectant transport system permease protein
MIETIIFMIQKKQLIWEATLQHVFIAGLAVLVGMMIAIPLGIWLTRQKTLAQPVITIAGILQTIPSLVLFGLAMPLFGIGVKTGLIVLILYSILPILQNTYTGIQEVDHQYKEAAKGMGMSPAQVLRRIGRLNFYRLANLQLQYDPVGGVACLYFGHSYRMVHRIAPKGRYPKRIETLEGRKTL